MATNQSSHVQQNGTKVADGATVAWSGLWNDHVARLEAFYAEMNKLQDQGLAQSKLASDESTKLFQAWAEYSVALSRDFQKLSIEGAKKSLELLSLAQTPRG
jgi:hypothetical protein